jgi:hypothetical protein
MAVLLAATYAQAAETVCGGHAWLTNAFVPIPLYRAINVTLNPGISELNTDSVAQVSIDMGGSPVNYSGTIDLTGVNAQQEADSGDTMKFWMKRVSENQLEFSQVFYNAEGQVEGTLHQTTLTCQ